MRLSASVGASRLSAGDYRSPIALRASRRRGVECLLLLRQFGRIALRGKPVRHHQACVKMRTSRRHGARRSLPRVLPQALARPHDLADEESQRTLNAAADAVADAIGEQMALEYFARLTGSEAS